MHVCMHGGAQRTSSWSISASLWLAAPFERFRERASSTVTFEPAPEAPWALLEPESFTSALPISALRWKCAALLLRALAFLNMFVITSKRKSRVSRPTCPRGGPLGVGSWPSAVEHERKGAKVAEARGQ